MTKPHTSRKYMTPVKFKGDTQSVLGYVASCRDCRFRDTFRSREKRDRAARVHTIIMEAILKVKRRNKEMAEKLLAATINRLGAETTLDVFVAKSEGYWHDVVTDSLIDALPEFDSDYFVLVKEYEECGTPLAEALMRVMVTENPEFV